MGRDGFALMAVLWLLAALSTLLVGGLGPLNTVRLAAENRTQLERARWAAESCLALAQARAADGRALGAVDSIAMGPGVWCSLDSLRPDERVPINYVDSVGLQRLLRDDVRVASILDWIDPDDEPRDAGAESAWYAWRGRTRPRQGPFVDPAEIRLVRGFDSLTTQEAEEVFTTRGDGSVSPSRAGGWALRTVSGMPTGFTEAVLRSRSSTEFLRAEQLVATLGIEPTIEEFREMSQRLSFADHLDVVRSTGYANLGSRIVESSIVVASRLDDGRLFVSTLEVR